MNSPLKTPTEWAALSGIRIIDIDGWRSPEEKDFSLPVTQEEFDGRVIRCTVQIVDWEKFRPRYPDFGSYKPNYPDFELHRPKAKQT